MPSAPDLAAAPSCAFMAALVGLLGEFPRDRDVRRAKMVAEHLDRLEHEARLSGAHEATLAAIKGARIVLEMSELPPLPPVRP